MEARWDKAAGKLHVTATFQDGSVPQKNDLWISMNRHPDYSTRMEYDAWSSTPMKVSAAGDFEAEMSITPGTKTVDVITAHAQTEKGSTLTVSSPALRLSDP